MKKEGRGIAGIRLISFIYLANAGLFFLAPFIFYSRILILGHPAVAWFSNLISFSLAVISLYLFIRLPKLKADAFWLALAFHFFSALNNMAMIIESFLPCVRPVLRVIGGFGPSGYSQRQLTVIGISILLNFLVLTYIIGKRSLFLKDRV